LKTKSVLAMIEQLLEATFNHYQLDNHIVVGLSPVPFNPQVPLKYSKFLAGGGLVSLLI
jgi:hypothetical protein